MILSGDVSGLTPALIVGQCYQWARREPTIPVPSIESVTRSLRREKFLGRQKFFQAYEGNGANHNLVGQVVARVSPTLSCPAGKPLGMLGFFAGLNQPALIRVMLKTAVDWLHEQGADCVVGPIDGDTWHSYRINVGPFDEAPFLMEPTNPPWYESLWTGAGFQVLDKYHSRVVTDVFGAAKATAECVQNATKLGYDFRPLNLNRFDSDLRTMYEISCASFAENFLYDPIDESEFLELYRPSKAIADPRLVLFALDSSGSEVGFLFNVIDYQKAVMAMKGGRGWLAKLRFLGNKKHANAVNFKSIGILPDHRRKSLAGALMHLGYKATIDMGYQRANLCLIRDGNASSKLDGGLGRILRRYTLYQTGRSQF